jgi:tRNA splicing endonuclease
MPFMVVEKFRNQNANPIYRHFRDKGRLMPEGLKFVSGYVAADLGQ